MKDRESTSHNWVIYSNPRNGKIRVQACEKCGALLNSALAVKHCEHGQKLENKMVSMGWHVFAESKESDGVLVQI